MDPKFEVVPVALQQNGYQIHIGQSGLEDLPDLFASSLGTRHVVVISDENVAAHYLNPVTQGLSRAGNRVDSIVVAPGEKSKSIDQANQLWQRMMELKSDRSSVVVALGGGVVGDLAGFIAATFMRGVPLVQIPTSLLAQVDSSVGGKTGVNLPQGKNLVGSFLQPQFVLISAATLRTLDEANFRAGMAEVVKYGVIMDEAFFGWLEQHVDAINDRDEKVLTQLIAKCCQCKASVVEEDERETTGRRAILNYGHTFGHAIESVYGYGSYLHGEAISIGMTCAARLAVDLSWIDSRDLDRQTQLLSALGLPVESPEGRRDELLAAMKRDKKSSGGQVQLILPERIGQVKHLDWPGDDRVVSAF